MQLQVKKVLALVQQISREHWKKEKMVANVKNATFWEHQKWDETLMQMLVRVDVSENDVIVNNIFLGFFALHYHNFDNNSKGKETSELLVV
jgi:hypothetical protein